MEVYEGVDSRSENQDTSQPKKMSEIADIVVEPKGNTYRALIDFAQEYSDVFSLIVHSQMPKTEDLENILTQLNPFLIEKKETWEWPGTFHKGKKPVKLFLFLCNDQTTGLLKNNVDSLYAWKRPKRPEDLSFYREGRCWLASISHESESFIFLKHVDLTRLKNSVPGLNVEIRNLLYYKNEDG